MSKNHTTKLFCTLSFIAGAACVAVFAAGCSSTDKTACMGGDNSVRYLGVEEAVPEEQVQPYSPNIGPNVELTPGENPQNIQAVSQQRQQRLEERKDRRSTGFAYVGDGLYFVFVRPFVSLTQPKQADHSRRNWIGQKISDDVPGVTAPSDRMKQIEALGQAAGKVSPDRAENYIAALTTVIKDDQDSNCRAVAVKSVAKYNLPSATYALNLAIADKAKHVRITACNSWATRTDPKQGAETLNHLLLIEDDKDVSLAAIHALQVCGNTDSSEALGRMLETSDPALQIAAMNSLGSIHNNPSRDITQWRQYCRGEIQAPIEQQKKFSIAEKLNIWK